MNALLFQIGIFPWFMIAATTIFFEPDWPRRLLRLPAAALAKAPRFALHQYLAVFLGVFAVLQILVPLRHFLYPGVTNWTEEGHTFAWHMKLRSKKGSVEFFAVDSATGDREPIDHEEYLTNRQYSKMATRPYMIRQFSHFLAEERRRQGRPDAEIRVEASAKLNGREYQRLIEPAVDLASVPYSLLPARWILPLETPLRSRQTGEVEEEE